MRITGVAVSAFLLALTAAVAPAGPEPVRTDRYGDPLPPGAVARLGTLRFRSPTSAEEMAFAPDGKTIAVTYHSGIDLFDVASGKRLRRLPPRAPWLGEEQWRLPRSPAWQGKEQYPFSPDGKRLATRGLARLKDDAVKKVVRVWDLAGAHKPREYDTEGAIWLGWSAEGEPLAVCLEGEEVCLRQLAAGRSRHFEAEDLQPLPGHQPACDYSPAGRSLAVADRSGRRVHVWDTASGEHRHVFRLEESTSCLVFAPDGSKLACISDRRLQAWDVKTGEVLYVLTGKGKFTDDPCFSGDGKTLAVWDSSNAICLFDPATGRQRSRLESKGNLSRTFAISHDGTLLATQDGLDCAIRIWDVATGKKRADREGHRASPFHAVFQPDSRRVLSGGWDGMVHLWDASTGEVIWARDRPERHVSDMALSADGRTLYLAWDDENQWICAAASGERQHTIRLVDPDRPGSRQEALRVQLSEDDRTLLAISSHYSSPMDTLITRWDTDTRRQLFRRYWPARKGWSVVLSADGRVLAVPHPEGEWGGLWDPPPRESIHLLEVATGKLLRIFPIRKGWFTPLAFSPDGRFLAGSHYEPEPPGKETPTGGYTIGLRELATGAEILALPASEICASFSADGRLLALVETDEIVVWDLSREQALRRFKGFDAKVISLVFSPDGRRLVSGLSDSTLLVWDVGPRQRGPANKLGANGLGRAWADLGGADASRAWRARTALASSPEEALPVLDEHLRPARPIAAERLARLLADLDSDQFSLREKAQADLEDLGELAEPAVQQALAGQPTPEARRRLEQVLGRPRRPVKRPEELRALRAVAVLEDIATPQACRLLERLAAGAPEAQLSREAKASLGRLQRTGGREHGRGE